MASEKLMGIVLRVQIALFCLSLVCVNSDEQMPRVVTTMGELTGYYKMSLNDRPYEAYEGIPYALPPVGDLRFMPPQRSKGWTGTLSATSFGNQCVQFVQCSYDNNITCISGNEDCLYLNIYVPMRNKISNTILMPVIFWIHDGFFQSGSGMRTGARYLMDRDVIVVTFNYRLGPFGFLSTEDEVVPGNMGLKDQSMALHWVSENIELFGGDKKRITLVGLDAGGASVHYHYLSQWSTGLFQGGISISGTAFNCWAQTENALEKTKKLSNFMKCPTNKPEDMIRCLRSHPIRNFKYCVHKLKRFLKNTIAPFGPVIENIDNEPFINKTPAEIVHSGDVQDIPWITGVVNGEAFYTFADRTINYNSPLHVDDWYTLAPSLLDFNYAIPKKDHIQIAHLIKKYYRLTGKNLNKFQIMEIMGDRLFVVDSEKAARMQAKVNRNPVWYYYYTYSGLQSICNTDFAVLTCHGDDAFAVMDVSWFKPISRQDHVMQQSLIDLWVSFATDRVPKIGKAKWMRLDPSRKEFQYLHINGPIYFRMDSNDNFGAKNLWNSINFNENRLKSEPIDNISNSYVEKDKDL